MAQIEAAFSDGLAGRPSMRPVIEMTLPSVTDPSICPPGRHVALLFVQYAPYALAGGASWDDPGRRDAFADSVFRVIEEHAPGFTASVLARDVLTPLDLERVFALPGASCVEHASHAGCAPHAAARVSRHKERLHRFMWCHRVL
jgi:phytoene dehydrogenase-like protein